MPAKQPTMQETLRQAILASGKSALALARETGVPQPSISKFLKGEAGLNFASAERLATYLGLELVPRNEATARGHRR